MLSALRQLGRPTWQHSRTLVAWAHTLRSCKQQVMHVLPDQAPLGALYDQLLEAPAQALAARAHASGLGFGFSQFAVFSVYALAFWYGGQLMREGQMDFAQVLKVRGVLLPPVCCSLESSGCPCRRRSPRGMLLTAGICRSCAQLECKYLACRQGCGPRMRRCCLPSCWPRWALRRRR